MEDSLVLDQIYQAFMVYWASLVAQIVKRLPAVQETWVWFLGWEDPLEKEMATHSSIHAWRIPWTEEPGRLQSMGLQRVGHDWATSLSFFFSFFKVYSLYALDISWLMINNNSVHWIFQLINESVL